MNDDLISRKAAITIPVLPKEYREYQTMNLDDAYELGWFDCQKYIEELPSAQPERKKGKWVKEKCRGLVYKCSACGNYLDFEGVNAGRGNANFCPNCGAEMTEMRGEQK